VRRPRVISATIACAALIGLTACGSTDDPARPAAAQATPASSVPAITAAAGAAASDDGCSADNSPTDVVAASGPAPAIAVRSGAASDTPLPDLVVRRINCAGGWVNLRNEVPADKPVLVWFWAPY
jgi:hypothetical protein